MNSITNVSQFQQDVRQRYPTLSKRLQQVAGYVLDNPNSVAFDTVAAIAKAAEVPPSTLIRFASAFEFNGFNEIKQIFQMHLVEETSSYTERASLFRQLEGDQAVKERPEHILYEFTHANAMAMERLANQIQPDMLQRAVTLLNQANHIYIVGLGRSFGIASYLTYALRHLDRKASLVDGSGGMFKEQISMVGPEDVVIAISYSPYAEETLITSQIAAAKGAQQIVLTDSLISPLASLSDVCFVVKEAQVDAFRSLSATQCLVQTLAVALIFEQSGPHQQPQPPEASQA